MKKNFNKRHHHKNMFASFVYHIMLPCIFPSHAAELLNFETFLTFFLIFIFPKKTKYRKTRSNKKKMGMKKLFIYNERDIL